MSDYIDDVFGEGGLLAQQFEGYSPRGGQVALARAVDRSLADGVALLAEAPTGVGKSVAYLVPAVYRVIQEDAAGAHYVVRRVVNVTRYPTVSEEHRRDATTAIQTVSRVCDGASTRDGQGFDGGDAPTGNSLARLSRERPLVDGEVWWATKAALKYHRQLPRDVVDRLAMIPIPEPHREARVVETVETVEPPPHNRVVVATANIALQEQLVKKDLPRLAAILPWKFKYALIKGVSNYLCLKQLRDYKDSSRGEFDEREQPVVEWAARTQHGDVSELPFQPAAAVWGKFSVSSDDCEGEDCDFYDKCHHKNAMRAASEAQIVVTNYHLLFAHFKVLDATAGFVEVLPSFGSVILDEGHKAVGIARDFFGARLTEKAVVRATAKSAAKQRAAAAAKVFFAALDEHSKSEEYKCRLRVEDPVLSGDLASAVSDARWEFAAQAARYDYDYSCDEEKREIRKKKREAERRERRCEDIVRQIQAAMSLEQGEEGWAYAVEHEDEAGEPRGSGGRVVLAAYPISVAKILRRHVFKRKAVVTSATLCSENTFDFVAGDIGAPLAGDGMAPPARTLVAASPFNWREQALLVAPPMPHPQAPAFLEAVAAATVEVVRLARGRTLGLYTSYAKLDAAHRAVLAANVAAGCPYRILRQGDMPRTRLIDEFRRDVSSVLLGTESFWAGVDVQGEALSCVLIDRLPFASPDDPVLDAIQERVGRGFFTQYSVPAAVIAFKQGFGRLIRHANDKGVVVCLDNRLTTKGYGWTFLNSLPAGVRRSTALSDVGAFLDGGELTGVPAESARIDGSGSVLGW